MYVYSHHQELVSEHPLKIFFVILMKFSSVAALEVVKMTTSRAATDENVIKMMTFLLQYLSW